MLTQGDHWTVDFAVEIPPQNTFFFNTPEVRWTIGLGNESDHPLRLLQEHKRMEIFYFFFFFWWESFVVLGFFGLKRCIIQLHCVWVWMEFLESDEFICVVVYKG